MVGSDKDSVKSGEQESPKRQEETLERQESCTPPPKPPRIISLSECILFTTNVQKTLLIVRGG